VHQLDSKVFDISVKFEIGDFYEICWEYPNLVNNSQNYRALCTKT